MATKTEGSEKLGEGTPTKKQAFDEHILDDGLSHKGSLGKSESDEKYPEGIRFILLTVGLMAVVLVLALDNYIISESRATTQFLLRSVKRPPFLA